MSFSPDLRSQGCGGSLVSDQHVLTSASCVFNDITYYVHLGDTILGNNKHINFNKTVMVTNKYLHPEYVNEFPFNMNNIAILKMAEPLPLDQYGNIKPVCLPDQGADFTGITSMVTGWGLGYTQSFISIFNYNYNSWLHELQVTVVANEVCDPILPSEICAGSMNIAEAPCLGDDGGPLVVSDPNVNNNGMTIAGIIHFNDCNLVETYTKVSMFRDWIDEIIGDSTTCPPPPSTNTQYLEVLEADIMRSTITHQIHDNIDDQVKYKNSSIIYTIILNICNRSCQSMLPKWCLKIISSSHNLLPLVMVIR